MMQDIALLKLHTVFAIDRAGLVGDDGPTHHGVFDVGYLRQIPGMKILCPVSFAEQRDMLHWAVKEYDGPVAIRYPRGGEGSYTASDWKGLDSETVKLHRKGKDVVFVTYGLLLDNVLEAAQLLAAQGIEATVLRLLSVSDLKAEEILSHRNNNAPVIVVEEVCSGSGIKEALAWELRNVNPDCHIAGIDLGPDFVTHGNQKKLYECTGLDAASIAGYTREVLSK
jgi:1-deoxy-D-xylulose-5-phosphate synthase